MGENTKGNPQKAVNKLTQITEYINPTKWTKFMALKGPDPITTSMAYETRRTKPHSQGLSYNSYLEPNQPNSS